MCVCVCVCLGLDKGGPAADMYTAAYDSLIMPRDVDALRGELIRLLVDLYQALNAHVRCV